MKKVMNRIKENVFIFILFFILFIGFCLNLSLTSSDEIWNFQNAYKIYNGLKIYEEVNVIITPLFFWCTELIFSLFTANLFVFRVSNAILIALLCLFTYKILKKLKIPSSVSLLTVLILFIQRNFTLVTISFNYNQMALLFFIIGLYFLINEKTREKIWIQAIITVLVILTKQNIGIFYLLGNIIYFIVSKGLTKEKIKQIFKYLSLVFLGCLIFIIYLIIDNNLYNFFSYAIGGISEFANENLDWNFTSILYLIGLLCINVWLSLYFIKKQFFTEKQRENIKILFVFSIALCLVIYPIFNWGHIIIGTYLIIINIVYMLCLLFKDFNNIIKKIAKIVNIFIIVVVILYSFYNVISWVNSIRNSDYPYSWEEPFFGGIIEKEEYEENQLVINYIKESEKKVIVVSNKAALYMIPLKISNGDFDLPFKGNLGIKGEEGLIEKIDSAENTQFLISKEGSINTYQESKKVREYIKNTKEYVGEISIFEIYE